MIRFNASQKRITQRPWGWILLGLAPLAVLAADAFGLFDLGRFADRSIIRLVGIIASGGLLFFSATQWRSIRSEGKRLIQRSLFRPKELRTKQAKVKVEETKKGGRFRLFIDDGKKQILFGQHGSEDRAQALAERIRSSLGCS